ncbi:alpha/beta hydrolase domain-containing protein WAV2-like isoform X3 [Salvia divinorum]|uniref:Alpha/beta hydrolase domain-containing protein WAV2-like isoform X3 n=1 Tax=Salvia divinorum TaxID=28513 RepID=A0ABD1I4M0_SALDI
MVSFVARCSMELAKLWWSAWHCSWLSRKSSSTCLCCPASLNPTPLPLPASYTRMSGSRHLTASVSMLGSSSSPPIVKVQLFSFSRKMLAILLIVLKWFGLYYSDCNAMFSCFHIEVFSYGASDGFPSQHGITKDAQAALDHLVQRADIDTSRIVVFGRSLGRAVGTVLVRNNPNKVAALILEYTFTSILDMAGVILPFLKWFIGKGGSKGPKVLNFFVRSPWSTIDVIGEVKQPIPLLSGLQDKMVPPSQMEMLYAKAAEFLEKTVPEKKDHGSSKVGLPNFKLRYHL